MTTFNCETIWFPTAEQIAPIEHGLHDFNVAHLGEDVINNYFKVAVLARDETGTVIGGIHGEMYWEWLHIQSLWVDEAHRGRGIGAQLLQAAEAAATEKGFTKAHLETTEYQAINFYLKRGYEIFGTLEGKPTGHTWYFIKKEW